MVNLPNNEARKRRLTKDILLLYQIKESILQGKSVSQTDKNKLNKENLEHLKNNFVYPKYKLNEALAGIELINATHRLFDEWNKRVCLTQKHVKRLFKDKKHFNKIINIIQMALQAKKRPNSKADAYCFVESTLLEEKLRFSKENINELADFIPNIDEKLYDNECRFNPFFILEQEKAYVSQNENLENNKSYKDFVKLRDEYAIETFTKLVAHFIITKYAKKYFDPINKTEVGHCLSSILKALEHINVNGRFDTLLKNKSMRNLSTPQKFINVVKKIAPKNVRFVKRYVLEQNITPGSLLITTRRRRTRFVALHTMICVGHDSEGKHYFTSFNGEKKNFYPSGIYEDCYIINLPRLMVQMERSFIQKQSEKIRIHAKTKAASRC